MTTKPAAPPQPTTIETLTDDARRALLSGVPAYEERKLAVRIIDAANARAEAAEREMHTAHLQTEKALRQRDDWKAKCEAAERHVHSLEADLDAQLYVRTSAESEAASLRATVDSNNAKWAKLAKETTAELRAKGAEVVSMRAEVERLRAHSVTVDTDCQSAHAERRQAESSLAAATGLLAESQYLCGIDELQNKPAFEQHAAQIGAFLANAPAAPTAVFDHEYPEVTGYERAPKADARVTTADSAPSTHSTSSATSEPTRTDREARVDAELTRKHRNGAPVRSRIAREMMAQLHYQGACNTQEDDLERWAFTADALAEAITLRTDRERAVLDAFRLVSRSKLKWLLSPHLGRRLNAAAQAELARREASR